MQSEKFADLYNNSHNVLYFIEINLTIQYL